MSHLLTFPTDDDAIGLWIESLLVSPDFAFVVSQLSEFSQDDLQDEVASVDSEAFYQSAATGLSHLSVKQCRWLLQNPEQLLLLNEKIFEFGSHYWMRKLKASPSDDDLFKRVAESISEKGKAAAKRTAKGLTFRSDRRSPELQSRRLRSTMRQLLIMAAVLLLCFLGLALYQMTAGGNVESWEWQTQELEETGTREQYFNSLDQSLTQWYDQPKGTGEQLSASLAQLSQGCDRLINASRGPLSKSDKDWLLDRCRAWKKTIDQFAIAAKSSSDRLAVEKVKSNADDLVSRISRAIKSRIQNSTREPHYRTKH